MGNTWSCCRADDPMKTEFMTRYPNIFGRDPKKIVILGQNYSGMHTFLRNWLTFDKEEEIIPIIGFHLHVLKLKSTTIMATYLTPNKVLRLYGHQFFERTTAVIIILDSTDMYYYFDALRPDLEQNLKDEIFEGLPILIFANKSDSLKAENVNEIEMELNLRELTDAPYFIQPLNALTGEGFDTGFIWLDEQLKQNSNKLNS